MARFNFLKTKKAKTVISFLLVVAIGLSLYFSLRPNDENKDSSKDPTYSYSQTDNSIGELSNSSFDYGTIGVKNSSFPRTSLNGWKLAKSSSAKSGVINTTDDAWAKLLESFYTDPGILEYVKTKDGIEKNDAAENIRRTKAFLKLENPELPDDYSPTNEDIKKYFAKSLFPKYFEYPGVHDGDFSQEKDTMIYMLNNYKTDETGSGSVQTLTSNREITLNKGQYAKISVWVKTDNIDYLSEVSGANVYVTNTFNGKTQAPYGYFNIDTNGKWEKYSFIIKGDDVYTTKFTLVLGLGFGDVYAEGTAYFDDILVEHLENLDNEKYIDAASSTTFTFDSDADYVAVPDSLPAGYIPVYSLDLDFNEAAGSNYFENLGFDAVASDYTVDVSVNGVNGKRFGNDSSVTSVEFENLVDENDLKAVADAPVASGNKYSIKNASYTAKFTSSDLANEEYAYVSFFIKNKLNTFYATTIVVNVIDTFTPTGGTPISNTRSKIVELTTPSDTWENCGIVIRNNFDRTVYNGNGTRSFVVEVVMGPTSLTSTNAVDYAYGDVYITTPEIAKGATYKYATTADEENDIQTANYKFYQFLSDSAKGFTSLYSGYESDYTNPDENAETQYAIAVAPSSIGAIYTRPATPASYKGIVADHYYINENSKNHEIDANKYAGVVNTEYISNYAIADFPGLTSALSKINDEDIQPLMIYTKAASAGKTPASYGYLSNTYTLGSSTNAKITLKVRVVGDATANIYLIDVDSTEKTVMSFKDFNAYKGSAVDGSNFKLQLTVDKNMMDSDGWATISFYIAAGVNSKTFRLEMWNGDREGNATEGYVFFNDISIVTASGFTEPSSYNDAFTVSGSPLFDIGYDNLDELYAYKQVSDDEDTDYAPSYVWAKNSTTIYAVYNTLEPVITADEDTDDETTTESETSTNPADFWLQLSSIILVAALVLAILALFIKNIVRRRRANKNDATSHYKVVSRTKRKKKAKPVEVIEEPVEDAIVEDEIIEEVEQVEETVEEKTEEQTLDSYVYGEVQSFGEESEAEVENNSEEQTEE